MKAKTTIEIDGIKISISSKHISIDKLINILKELVNVLEDKNVNDTNVKINNVNINNQPKKQINEPKIRPVIRDRLPNNLIDINDLNIKKAIVENSLVRCPSCGQSHCLIINADQHYYFMRKNYKKSAFDIVLHNESSDYFNGMLCEDKDKLLYYQDIQSLAALDEDAVCKEDSPIMCPVCGKTNDFETWKDAWINPLKYFETEQLCRCCGGEMTMVKSKNKKVMKCEVCNFEEGEEK